MKKVIFVFNSPNLTNRVFEVADDAISPILSEWRVGFLDGVGTSVRVPTTGSTYYLRSDLIAYIKVLEDTENE
jgi:hypothetical protein